jgi:hypothetical protein
MSDEVKREPTAKERLEKLEQGLLQIETALVQVIQAHTLDVSSLKQDVKALKDLVEAFVKTSNRDEKPTPDNLRKALTENTIEDLVSMIKPHIDSGVLKDTEMVTMNTFVVGQEIDGQNNEIVNPRIQFPVQYCPDQNLQTAVIGKLKGDSVTVQENVIFKILEVYEIIQNDQVISEE